MRIVSGKFRGKRFIAPKNLPVRPTTDIAKESLFNILNNYYYFEDIVVLDLFSGIGSISLEMASRGVQDITSVDLNFHCVKFLRESAESIECSDIIHPLRSDVFRFLDNCHQQFDIVFADPPYDLEGIENIPAKVYEKNLIKSGGILIVEHGPYTNLSELEHFWYSKTYGNVTFSFFDHEQSDDSE